MDVPLLNAAAAPSHQRLEVHSTAETHFSWLRTRMSAERTLMSCVRTSVALIGFGFTIVQFLDRLRTMSPVEPTRPEAARYLGLALIAAGVIALLIDVLQYRAFIRYLWCNDFHGIAGTNKAPLGSSTLALAILLMLVGVSAFAAVVLRVP